MPPLLMMEGGSSDDDMDADGNYDDSKVQGELEDANVGSKRKASTASDLAAYRGGIRVSLRRATRRYHAVLVRQRMHLETSQPEFAVAADADKLLPVGMSLEEARRQVDEAYEQMDVHVKALVDSLKRVRQTERILCPSAFAQPAIVMLAVSAPSTSWAVDDVIIAPFPRIAASIKDIFLAGYSNPDKRDNKLKRMYVRTKKALPQKPPTGYA